MKIISQNKKASFDYFLLDTYEAGIKLTGTEIKSIRDGKTNLNDAYIQIKNGRAYIINMFIAKYEYGNLFNHDERRTRELLLHKREILKLFNKVKLEGVTLIPTKIYLKEALCKIEFSVAKGKKNYDKREDIKKKDLTREIEKSMKRASY